MIAPTLKLGIALLSGGNAAVQQVQPEDCKMGPPITEVIVRSSTKPYFIYNVASFSEEL